MENYVPDRITIIALFVRRNIDDSEIFGGRFWIRLDKSIAAIYDAELSSAGWHAMFDEKRIGHDRRTASEDTRDAGEVVERRRRRRRQMVMREISFTEWARYFAMYKRRK